MSRASDHRYRWVLLLLFTSLLGACGFHLRSYDFESALDSFAVTSGARIRVAEPLRRGLRQAGVNEAAAAQASLVIELLDQRNERRSISTSGQARAAEYEVSFAVQYQIFGANNNALVPPTWIKRERVYRVDRDNIVGSSEEQAVVERELLADLVNQLIRAMDAVSRNLSADAGTDSQGDAVQPGAGLESAPDAS